MKCDELKRVKDSFWVLKGKGTPVTSADGYNADEVDAAIAELKEKIKIYEDFGSCKTGCPALRHNQRRIESEIYKSKLKDKELAELKVENERLEEERRWRKVDKKFPTADDGYFFVLWEDGLPDVGYIGTEDDVIETVRDRGEGHSVEYWMPQPKAPEELDEKVH